MNTFVNLLQEKYPDEILTSISLQVRLELLHGLYNTLEAAPKPIDYIELEQFLDYFTEFDDIMVANGENEMIPFVITKYISFFSTYNHLYEKLKSIMKKYDLEELYLVEALNYCLKVQYNGFSYSRYANEVLKLYKDFKDKLRGHEQLFIDALYCHFVGLGDSELGYEFGGLEKVRNSISILDTTLIELLLNKYEHSSIHNFPYGWSYLGNSILEKQIKTIIDFSNIEDKQKNFYAYYYLQGFEFKTIITRKLHTALFKKLGKDYTPFKLSVETLRQTFTITFKHDHEVNKDISIIMENSDSEKSTKYTLKGTDNSSSECSIIQSYFDSEIRISFNSEVEIRPERFVFQKENNIQIKNIDERLNEPIDTLINYFHNLKEQEKPFHEQTQLPPSKVIKEYNIAVVCAMKSELDAIRNISNEWVLLDNEQAAQDLTTNYYSCNFADSTGKVVSVVAASCYQKGMAASATLSTKLITLFKPEYLVMTGIAAGIKKSSSNHPEEASANEKMKLGDILVATVTWDHGSGKITTEENGSSDFLPAPNPINLQPRIRAKIELLANNSDLLTEIRNEWTEKPEINMKNKEGDAGLTIHCGPVLSGAAVLANKDAILGIRKQHKDLIGIDMESYSVFYAAENSPGIQPKVFVLKSISDFADEEKNDDLQPYAAYTSAAALKALALNYLDYQKEC